MWSHQVEILPSTQDGRREAREEGMKGRRKERSSGVRRGEERRRDLKKSQKILTKEEKRYNGEKTVFSKNGDE